MTNQRSSASLDASVPTLAERGTRVEWRSEPTDHGHPGPFPALTTQSSQVRHLQTDSHSE